MRDAFLSRLWVALADRAAATTDIGALADPSALKAKRALAATGIPDVAPKTVGDLDLLAKADHEDLSGIMLRAFWREQLSSFRLHPLNGSCLLVNPPEGLNVETDSCATLSRQQYLAGKYGTQLTALPMSPVHRMSLGTSGCFDEVLVFWDRGVDFKPLLDCLTVGSTVALFRPSLDHHRFWIDWCELDYGFKLVTGAVAQRFSTTLVHSAVVSQVSLHIFGLSGVRT